MGGARVTVLPVTPDRWGDQAELFERKGPRGGTPPTAWCWCMWWRQRAGDGPTNKRNMHALVRDGQEPGLLAYEGEVPVGWVSVGPREQFGQLVRSRAYGPRDDDTGVWSIVCFYVPPGAKRRGVATTLLERAVEHAFGRGATAVEAYPGKKLDYMGQRKGMEALGFRAVRDAGARTVMRLAAQ